ncbi:hypothetical protein Pan153_13860 [Gimesia panareensis]|uniref:Uncharacterized protein n=1 Tax=Gimesia panareensis TaxID=2527978 RepID=A0A518FK76_9PLAN|nr:hypothetical protein [Gimesia panareensis]QDV16754.1 hypothetical protein Pan153_13860 [Gimesia panareensis]
MSKGYGIVLGGLILFLGILYYSGHQGNQKSIGLGLEAAFLILSLGIWTGCIFIAIDKGYSWLEGFICGMFGPLGLLILTLSRNRHPPVSPVEENS